MTFQTQELFLIRNILIKCVFGPVSSSACVHSKQLAGTALAAAQILCPPSKQARGSSLSPALPLLNPSRGTALGLKGLQGVLAGTLS